MAADFGVDLDILSRGADRFEKTAAQLARAVDGRRTRASDALGDPGVRAAFEAFAVAAGDTESACSQTAEHVATGLRGSYTVYRGVDAAGAARFEARHDPSVPGAR